MKIAKNMSVFPAYLDRGLGYPEQYHAVVNDEILLTFENTNSFRNKAIQQFMVFSKLNSFLHGVVIFMLSWNPKQRDKTNNACLGMQRGRINLP